MTDLEIKLLEQNRLFREEVQEMMKFIRKYGVGYFLCLSCGMPTYTGQSSCSLCPIQTKEQVNVPNRDI